MEQNFNNSQDISHAEKAFCHFCQHFRIQGPAYERYNSGCTIVGDSYESALDKYGNTADVVSVGYRMLLSYIETWPYVRLENDGISGSLVDELNHSDALALFPAGLVGRIQEYCSSMNTYEIMDALDCCPGHHYHFFICHMVLCIFFLLYFRG